ncbi:putative ABC transport system permease protein [Burkholderiales bacterium 8X]|nr:putative ABC transport system permease protein [Burkholderiales bacterium 8X]
MKPLFGIAWRSAWNRRFTLALTVLSIALSTLLLLGVERIRAQLRESFSSSVSGTDLIVGARGGSSQLLLYSVFRIGSATHNMQWRSVQAIAAHPGVDWAVPLSLGDSHRSFPVLATTAAYFEHFRYGDRQPLALRQGKPFEALFDVVLGAEVAERLGYTLGERITLSHGAGGLGTNEHADKPFTVVGVLARTGTPVDRSLHIGLEAMEAIHLEWAAGAPMPGLRITADQVRKFDLAPKSVTAVLVGLKNRSAVFNVQRFVSGYAPEPLLAILPGVALDELWTVVGMGENALLLMSSLVALVSIAGLVSVVMAGLNERRRELAVLRAVGAGPRHVLALLVLEGGMVSFIGVLLGALLAALGTALLSPWLQAEFGLSLRLSEPTLAEWQLIGGVLAAGTIASLLPGIRAYRLSLADGLSPRT